MLAIKEAKGHNYYSGCPRSCTITYIPMAEVLYRMNGKMKAALKAEAAPGATIALVDIPRIGPRDVLVRVKAVSICGTDMHIYDWNA